MPATPPASPRFAVTRHAQSDAAIFSDQFNEAVDKFDNAALLTELTAEVSRATGAEGALATAITTGDASEAATRGAAITAEVNARMLGDTWQFVHVMSMDDQTSPWQPVNSVVVHVPVVIVGAAQIALVGVATRAIHHGATPSVYKVLTDHGHSDGSLSTATGLASVEPVEGRYLRQFVTSGGTPTPLVLNDLDTVALQLTTPGDSKGIGFGLLFGKA